jgi:hypothetical protein
MEEIEEYMVKVLINGDRPDFRVFSVYLWGNDHSFDSDGDSYNPASRSWTWLRMSSRVVSGNFEINQVSEYPLIFEVRSSYEDIINRVALFLAKETNGQIVNVDNTLLPYHFLSDKLGIDFDLAEALKRADLSIWRQSTLENPYPNLS